ncbi:MAG: hypothetical protein HFG29_06290 [Eubacterium sp.]|nr:hypothetical protein [Eubacterium sp.]
MLFKVWSSGFLLGCAIVDLKTKKVYQNICIINYIIAIVIKLHLSQLQIQPFIAGLCLCMVLLLISVISKQAIGYGDVFIMLALTGILHVKDVVKIFFLALFICCVFSMFMLLTKRLSIKSTVPFVPFLLAGDIAWIILGEMYVL